MSMAALILMLLVGGLLAWQAERVHPNLPRWVALATVAASLLYLLLTVPMETTALVAEPGDAGTWLLHLKVDWMPRFGIALELAMDGLSLLLLVLTLLLGLVAIASSWSEIDFKPGLFQANLVWTLAGVCGVFLAVDLFLFFLFWEVMLIPMYLLIAIWGHENKTYAAMKFFIFTQVSGLLMLLAIVVLAWQGRRSTGSSVSATSICWVWHWTHAWPGGPCWVSSWLLPSNYRLFLSIPGCPTPTHRPRPPAACCWPESCSRPAPTACCAFASRSFQRPRWSSHPSPWGLEWRALFTALCWLFPRPTSNASSPIPVSATWALFCLACMPGTNWPCRGQ